MSWKYLGETFDIHGGGLDLVFPHHENEIAQTRCAFGHEVMANIWMHNGHLQVEGEKMSKSLGNFVTIHELLYSDKFGGRSWPGEALRLAMLGTHYRKPIDFTVKGLEEAERTLLEWRRAIEGAEPEAPVEGFVEALADDLNTPRAISELHTLKARRPGALLGGVELLGIDLKALALDTGALRSDVREDEVEALVVAREAARRNRNWAESDRLRDELETMGVALKDNKDGTTSWEPKA
jgi:cysteinyl-tRNA synthetase